jgi:hypothetical protein
VLGVLVGVADGVGVEVAGSVGGGVLLALAVGVGVLVAAALVVSIGPPGLGVLVALAVAPAVSNLADAESACSCAFAVLIAAEFVTEVAGCCPHVLVAAVVCTNSVGCVPARSALTTPAETSDTPANMLSADVPTRRTVMMAPSSSWSSRPGSRVSSCLMNRFGRARETFPATPIRHLRRLRAGIGVPKTTFRAGKYQSGSHGPA